MDVNWMQKQFGATLIRRNSRIFLVLASLPAKSPRNESRRWSLGQITVSITAKRESLLKKTCFLLHVNSRKRKSKYCPMWISESGKSLPVESGIQEIFLVEFQILGFGIPITIWIRIRNSTDKESGIQFLESGIHDVESRIQDCPGFPYNGRYITINVMSHGRICNDDF